MADEDVVINEGVWVVHPNNPEAPQLISSTALERFQADGFEEMADRARVRDADQVRLFGPAPEPGGKGKTAPAPAGGKSGPAGAGEGN